MYCFYNFDSYQESVDFVIEKGGDTDTNAAITGALLGCYLGYDVIIHEEKTLQNIEIVLNADFSLGDNPKEKEYCFTDFEDLCAEFSEFLI